jgi:hypothetical protein
MTIHQTMPEDFLLLLPNEDAASKVFNDGKALRGPRFTLLFKKWSRFAHASASSLSKLVDIEIRGILEHAWFRSTAEHILRNSCWITEVHHNTVCGRDFASFWVRAWCLNPERLCRKLDLHIIEPRDAIHEKRCLTYKIAISCRPVDLHTATSVTPPPPPPAPFWGSDDDQDHNDLDPHLRRHGDAGDSRRPIQFHLGPRLPLGRAHDVHVSRVEDPLPLRVSGDDRDDETAEGHEALPLRVSGKDGDEETAEGHETQSLRWMGNEEGMAADRREMPIPDVVDQRSVEKLKSPSNVRPGGPRGWIARWTPQLDVSAGPLNTFGSSSPHQAPSDVDFPLAESLGSIRPPLPQQISLAGLQKETVLSSPRKFLLATDVLVNGTLGLGRLSSPQQDMPNGLLERPGPGSPLPGAMVLSAAIPSLPPAPRSPPTPRLLSWLRYLLL